VANKQYFNRLCQFWLGGWEIVCITFALSILITAASIMVSTFRQVYQLYVNSGGILFTFSSSLTSECETFIDTTVVAMVAIATLWSVIDYKETSVHSLTTPLHSFPFLHISLYICIIPSYLHHLWGITTCQWLSHPIVNDYRPPTLMHTLAALDTCWTHWATSVWPYSTPWSHANAYIWEAWY
jgi:hypothetical protein